MTVLAERSPEATTLRPRRSRRTWVAAVALPLVLAVTVVFAFGTAAVQNESMSPTIHGGDVVVFDRWSTPARGDIVLLVDTEGWSGEKNAMLVKRIVGIEGDVIVCCETPSGRLLVNDEPLDEPYVDAARSGGSVPFRVTVPDGTVWVMGDNRDASADSRESVSAKSRGGVARESLRGVVRAWWPGHR